jgi:hypothetical protein
LRADMGSDLLMWTLVENYTHMDLAVIGELNLDSCLAALQLDPPVYSTTSPGELSCGRLDYSLRGLHCVDCEADFLQRLTLTIEASLHKEVATETHKWPRQGTLLC